MASPSANTLQHNVRSYGAKGDGSTDDTAAIQAAVDAAGVTDGMGHVYFPSGNYQVSSSISLNTPESVRITGTIGNDTDPSPGVWHKTGVRVRGSFNGAIFSRTLTANRSTRIEDIGISNGHAAGTCVSLAGLSSPGGVFNCTLEGFIGINMVSDIFNAQIVNTKIVHGQGGDVGSRGIMGLGLPHTNIYNVDINGFERGIWAQQGGNIIGARIEACTAGIYLGGGGYTGGGFIGSVSTEACDTGIHAQSAGSCVIAGVGINGTAGAPSGSSDYAINIIECFGMTLISVLESGTHSTNFLRTEPGVGINNLTLIGCRGTTTSSIADLTTVELMNCTGPNLGNVIRAPVIATGSLPAAGAQQNGRVVIEDNGTGDRNLIIYGGGQRFRLYGGTAF